MNDHRPVLVVDDDADIRETIVVLLEAEGYRAIGASSAAEALERLKADGSVALVLVNLRMPGMSGTELMKVLKEDPGLAHIPVVVISGDNAAKDVALETGAAACLTKPIELQALLATANRFAA